MFTIYRYGIVFELNTRYYSKYKKYVSLQKPPETINGNFVRKFETANTASIILQKIYIIIWVCYFLAKQFKNDFMLSYLIDILQTIR